MERKPYLIIGNSTAALGAIEGIRSVDPTGPITLVAKENDPIYARPLISYWLAGKIGDDQMSFVPKDFYESSAIEPLLGAEVVRVDSSARSAHLADGRVLPFEKLLIAGGGTPILPPEPDVSGLSGVTTFTCWDDARRVRAWIREGKVSEAVVVGGGFIGIKTIEALLHLGVEPPIVELADRLMGAAFDDDASALALAALERSGATVRCGTAIQSVQSEDGHISAVVLRDGSVLPCHLLLFAIGVRPNIHFLDGSGIPIDRGLLVDDRMETSVPGIYAAGDISQAKERLTGVRHTVPILRNARRQGRVAGANMAGGADIFHGAVAMNSTDVCGLPCISIGLTNPPDSGDFEVLISRDARQGRYKKIVLQDNNVVGAILVGAIARAGVLRHLIEEAIDVTPLRGHLLADDFPLDLLPPAYWQQGECVAARK